MRDSRGRVSVEAVQAGVLVGFRGIGRRVSGKEVVQSTSCESCRRICFGVSQRLDRLGQRRVREDAPTQTTEESLFKACVAVWSL